MKKQTATRKLRPIVLSIAAMLAMVTCYFGAYFASLSGMEASLAGLPSGGSVTVEWQPRYRFAQKESAAFFWLAYRVDRKLRPERFTSDLQLPLNMSQLDGKVNH